MICYSDPYSKVAEQIVAPIENWIPRNYEQRVNGQLKFSEHVADMPVTDINAGMRAAMANVLLHKYGIEKFEFTYSANQAREVLRVREPALNRLMAAAALVSHKNWRQIANGHKLYVRNDSALKPPQLSEAKNLLAKWKIGSEICRNQLYVRQDFFAPLQAHLVAGRDTVEKPVLTFEQAVCLTDYTRSGHGAVVRVHNPSLHKGAEQLSGLTLPTKLVADVCGIHIDNNAKDNLVSRVVFKLGGIRTSAPDTHANLVLGFGDGRSRIMLDYGMVANIAAFSAPKTAERTSQERIFAYAPTYQVG